MSDSSAVGYEWYSETDMKLPLFATHSHKTIRSPFLLCFVKVLNPGSPWGCRALEGMDEGV